MTRIFLFATGILMLLTSCGETTYAPKPRAYPRIEYPEKQYQDYNVEGCPFTFSFPAYAEIKDKDKPCWFDIYMPAFEARIHCSYLPVHSRAEHDDFVKDAFTIANKINARANYMEQAPIHNSHGVGGLSLTWTGPAASPMHFFVTDTTHHFFTAALYFDSKVQPDSLAPIVAFIQKDVDQMISSFTWK